MKNIFTLFFSLFFVFPVIAQEDFVIENQRSKVVIPFKLINNLIFMAIKVNGIELNFLLDSGLDETILFSMEDKKEVSFNNVQKIKLRGLGSEEEIEGLKSTNNFLETHGLVSKNHLVYVILDQGFNMSSHIGIPVNGIIGYRFFRNNIVEINYQNKKIVVHRNNEKTHNKLEKKYTLLPLTIERSKPYINATAIVDEAEIPAKLLIDIGNSDSFWIFENDKIKLPKKNFPDFLGIGFSGDIEGHRAKISKFYLADFEFKNAIVGFPDSTSIRNINMLTGRIGSVGGEIFKRFNIVFDYADKKLYLKPNNKFKDPFTYNKSGITVQHKGLQWVQETVHLEMVNETNVGNVNLKEDSEKRQQDFKYKFLLKPIYEIGNVRKNSAAEKAGVKKGDVIISINKNKTYNYTLEQINQILKSEKNVRIDFEIERNSKPLKFSFNLEDEL